MNGLRHKVINEFCADSIFPRKASLKLEHVSVNQHGRLEITIDNQVCEYPVAWLRHNCQCSSCFNVSSLSYSYMMKETLNLRMEIKSVSQTLNGVKCVFIDDHTAEFSTLWLYNRRLTDEGNRERCEKLFVHNMVAWPESNKVVVQEYTYQQVTETKPGLEGFSNALIRDGIVKVTGAPDKEVYLEFGDLTGMLPVSNHYGQNIIVKNDPAPTNTAFTSSSIDFHVDLAYTMLNCSCIQLLHCMRQSKTGGENIMSDGVKAALVLRERHPEYYQMLTTTKIHHEDIVAHPNKHQYYMASLCPVISLGDNGEPKEVRFSAFAHSSFFPGSAEEYERFAEALKEFYNVLYEVAITLKSKPGDIIAFDNQRVMHGRLGYPVSEERRLEVFYLDWDSIYSSIRISSINKH